MTVMYRFHWPKNRYLYINKYLKFDHDSLKGVTLVSISPQSYKDSFANLLCNLLQSIQGLPKKSSDCLKMGSTGLQRFERVVKANVYFSLSAVLLNVLI